VLTTTLPVAVARMATLMNVPAVFPARETQSWPDELATAMVWLAAPALVFVLIVQAVECAST
jgi:hypothetical protein